VQFVRATAFVLCVVGLGALPSPCLGAEGDPAPIGPRLGFALGAAYGEAHGGRVDATPLSPILQLDLGITIGKHFSVYALGEAGTLIFTVQAAAYAVVEWSPIPRLFLGTGIGGDTLIDASFASCRSTCPDTSWAGYSVPLIAGIDVARLPRGALRLDLEAAGGIDPRTSVFGWHTAFTFGWALD
jgi:hypothetical protein